MTTDPDALLAAALALPEPERRRLASALVASLAPKPLNDAPTSRTTPVSAPAFGVDGCRGGWLVVWRTAPDRLDATVAPRFADVLTLAPSPATIAIDVPIGLTPAGPNGARDCDGAARKRLGPRASSVFTAPCRPALDTFRHSPDYATVSLANREATGRGLSQQCFGIFPKIEEVDALIDPALQSRVIEVHPELCFAAANDHRPLASAKKTQDGARERVELLERIGIPLHALLIRRAKLLPGTSNDDLLDALIALWTAERFVAGTAQHIGSTDVDDRGLRMQMWF